jgi:hypothetical protein
VQDVGQGWFTILRDPDPFTVCGDIGSPPTGFVTVTGIVTDGAGPNGERYFIRVRRPSDVTRLK